jgi:hypothetical protein
VPSGKAPVGGQCADQGAPSCMKDGLCNGAGSCELYVAGTTCAPPTCMAGISTQAGTCNGMGTCQPGTSSSCNTYACDTNNTCHTTCTTATMATDCAAGYVCNTGVCSKKLNSVPCGAGTECQSGQCQQGVCCASSCTGLCRSCAFTGTEGTCTLAAVNTDPANQCPDDGAPSCARDGMCDAFGACRLYAFGTTCGATTCPVLPPGASTFTPAPLCNGSGVCKPGTQSTCTPFVCGATGACLASCMSNADCVSPNTCNPAPPPSPLKVCGKKSNGASCGAPVDCASGNCNQSTCCATACTGTCQSCAVMGSLGTCTVIPAGQAPVPPTQCTNAGAASCGNDGTCNGSGACRNYGAGTPCVAAMCAASSFTPGRICNGTGTCNPAAAMSCGLYVCNGSGCLSSCTTTADCTPPLLCNGGGGCSTTLINAGGPAVQSWVADIDFTGGGVTTPTAAAIDRTGLTNPAPEAVYQTGHTGPGSALSYTIPGFTGGSSHVVRLHFCETYWPPAAGPGAGNRICNITINGTLVLPNFDIFMVAGAKNKAVIEPFTVNANAAGAYVIQFMATKDQCLVNGIEIQ